MSTSLEPKRWWSPGPTLMALKFSASGLGIGKTLAKMAPKTFRPIHETQIQKNGPSGSLFAGFSLMHVPLFANYTTMPGRDLRAAGYTKVTFYARANLSSLTSITIEAGGPNPEACVTLSVDGTVDNCQNLFTGSTNEGHRTDTISGNWKQYTLPISGTQQSAIKDFFKATLVFDGTQLPPGNTNPGQGGTLYLDQIFYKP